MKSSIEPSLAAPGAGLPKIELIIARLRFAAQRAAGSAASFNTHLQQERANIRRLIEGLDAGAAARPVLIERPRGLEDSSRYWSVWMTLEHLRIVNLDVGRIIRDLVRGTAPAGVVSTATVKPGSQVTGEVVGEYEKSCDALMAASAGGDLRTPLRHRHPWFGSLDAAGWHALAAGHVGLHRVQIERIVNGLRAG